MVIHLIMGALKHFFAESVKKPARRPAFYHVTEITGFR